MSRTGIKVGDVVYWYTTLAANARPWPATVMAVNAAASQSREMLDLNVHQPNRVMHRQSTFHRSEKQLQRWRPEDLTELGCWQTVAEAEEAKQAAAAALAAAAAENQLKLQEQELARQLEEETRLQEEAKQLEESQRLAAAGNKPTTPSKPKASAAA